MAYMRVRVNMRLPEELLERVDGARGDVSRTRFVERAIEWRLDGPSTEIRVDRSVLEARPGKSGHREAADARQAAEERREVARQFVTNVEPQRYRCPRDCDSSWRPSSPTPRCPSCRREVVPA